MPFKKTKIVCTIGPSSWDYDTLKRLAEAGMDVARLNFSHGSHEEKAEQIKHVRKISVELGKPLAIVADLQGPKLRLGDIEGKRQIKKDEKLEIAVEAVASAAKGDQLPIQFDLTPFIKPKERLFLNDALVEVIVDKVEDGVIYGTAQNDGVVSSHKGVNVPDTDLQGRGFTEKDFEDAEFAIKENVDYLALSYVQTGKDVQIARDLIEKHKSSIKTIAKIEMQQAMDNLEEIIKLSDALMVARGDMAIETKASLVPIYQQKIVRMARQYQKPVIVATQMLESMTENPRPTRAEVSDVGNAVFDQSDAVMLSAESASGKYPVETVETMAEVISSVEQHPDYKNYIKIDWKAVENVETSAIASSAASLAYRIGANAIIVCTSTGRTARSLSSFRPDVPIITITYNDQVRNQMSLIWGVQALVVEPNKDFATFLEDMVRVTFQRDLIKRGDKIVVVTGSTAGITGSTDMIKVLTV